MRGHNMRRWHRDASIVDPCEVEVPASHAEQRPPRSEVAFMRRTTGRILLSLLPLLPIGATCPAHAQPPTTIGLILDTPGAFVGYTLFESFRYPETYLINNQGLLVHSWQSQYDPGLMAYILENGHLLRGAKLPSGGSPFFGRGSGMAQEFDWDGNLLWEFTYSNSTVRHHHDLAPLPNGNVLMIAWEYKSSAEAVAAGRDPGSLWDGELWPDHIIEVQPDGATSGTIVWEWHVWDHLIQDFDPTKANFGIVADHPERIDLNYHQNHGYADWLHMNAVDYNADLDQIVMSVPRFNEFWIIDHSTTTEEAAGSTGGIRGMGGDILYRWGNPQAYGRGTNLDMKFFFQHDSQWIKDGQPGAGNILVFNNGNGRPEGAYSSVEEIETTIDANGDYPVPPPWTPHGPGAAEWIYIADPPESLFSHIIAGAQRQPNGNTLICEGTSGNFLEVDDQEQLVWQYINPVDDDGPMTQGDPPIDNFAFRVHRYAPDFAGFTGRDLTPGAPIELYSTGIVAVVVPAGLSLQQNHPNPFGPTTTIGFALTATAPVTLEVYDIAGRRVATLVEGLRTAGDHSVVWSARGVPSGVYHYALRVGSETTTRKMIVLR